ncbi:hypothetical protein HGO38_30290 [Rhizobium sp. CG5]|uniref:hypothetical protein n=1 Tax=Rhizobium sp. CG5 TaxID=2726076 RepID=UPI0020332E07|nr:hypothetical protein [Rhizobium sp. CG5]MCM2477740.1 hypothetical protein [Rhizobium sp. CG5]
MTNVLVERFPWLDQASSLAFYPGPVPISQGGANFAEQVQRFHKAGITHVSLTVASGREFEIECLSNFGEISGLMHDAGIALVETAKEVIAARNEGRFSASLHFQSAHHSPFSGGHLSLNSGVQ